MFDAVENIRLRALEASDLELFYVWENDPDVWRVGETMAPLSRDSILDFIRSQRYDFTSSRQMRLVIEVDNVAIGCVDIFDYNPVHRRFGLGILIYAPEHRRKGYARSVVEIVKSYALNTLSLKQIWVDIDEDNLASIALFESCGFVRSGHRKEWISRGDRYIDQFEYQCILY